MKCVILVVLSVVAMAAHTIAAVPHKRQMCNIAMIVNNAQCASAITSVNAATATILAGSSQPTVPTVPGVPTVPTTINRGNVESALNTLCGSTCYSQAREFYRCLGGEQYFTSGICGRRNGEFCILSLIQDNMPVEVPLCAPLTSCSPNCSATLSQVSDRLGCCAASLYNTTSSPLSAFGRQYATCQLSLGETCSGAASVFYLSGVLLVAIASIAVAIL